MTPEKCNSLMQGQTAIAKKVFECVPSEEPWRTFQIMAELKRRTGSTADMRIVQGCLRDLADSGVIRKSGSELYQRVSVVAKPVQKPEEKTVAAVKEVKVSANVSPIEVLGELAGEVTALAVDVEKRLKKIASRIEEAALTIEQQREADSAGMEKLRQLQNLLKGL